MRFKDNQHALQSFRYMAHMYGFKEQNSKPEGKKASPITQNPKTEFRCITPCDEWGLGSLSLECLTASDSCS